MSRKNNYHQYDNRSSIDKKSKKNVSKMRNSMYKQKKREEEKVQKEREEIQRTMAYLFKEI